MVNVLLGALGSVCVLALVAVGFFAGWKVREKVEKKPVEQAGKEERDKLIAQHEAWQKMMAYSLNDVYSEGGSDAT